MSSFLYTSAMSYYCHKCSAEVDIANASSVGRREECSKCSSDLHACLNCKFYDQSAYNECREPQAERVVDKDRANFCDYFTYAQDRQAGGSSEADSAKAALDDLFK